MTQRKIPEFIPFMVATNDLERELAALTDMRLRWRHEPDTVRMIDSAMTLMSELSGSHHGADLDALEMKSLALSRLMRGVFEDLASIRVH